MVAEVAGHSIGSSWQLLKTDTGQRLHIAPCPHILGAEVVAATEHDLATGQVCSWCEPEIAGKGRQYFASIEGAMKVFGTFSDTRKPIEQLAGSVEYDEIWTPASQSYVALGFKRQMVAWFGKTHFVNIVTGERVELPGYEEGGGGGTTRVQRVAEICSRCSMEMPFSGICEYCR